MVKYPFIFVATFLTLVAGVSTTSQGRGFGGMHGGGGRMGGGARMGGARMPNMGGGARMPNMGGGARMPNMGAARMPNMGSARMPNMGGARMPNMGSARMPNMGGGMSPGAMRGAGGGLGGTRTNVGGLPGAGANRLGGNPYFTGQRGGDGLANLGHATRGFPGGPASGFGHAARTPGASAEKGGGLAAKTGPLGAIGDAKRPSEGQLSNFLGLPSDGGLHSLNHPAAGRAAGDRAAGDRVADRAVGNRAVGDRIGMDDRGHQRRPAADLARRGDLVRRDFRGRGFYNRDWYRRYPGAWFPRRWAYANVWAAMTWDYLNGWFDYGDVEPIYYDYGNTVVYQDNSVYVNGQDVGTSDEYYQQASDLADVGAVAPDADTTSTDGDDGEWLPLGVFAMSHDQQTKANLIVQLAVNKQGIIRGNYTATVTDDTKPIQGSVDKKSQRAAWTIGDNKTNVFETGIYNLTKDEVPILVHYGKAKTEQWSLIRLNDDGDPATKAADKDDSSTEPVSKEPTPPQKK